MIIDQMFIVKDFTGDICRLCAGKLVTDLQFKIRISGIVIVISSHVISTILTLVIRVTNEGNI